jgi:predicted nucleic acid-binding protein
VDAAALDRALDGVQRVFLDSSTCIAYHSTAEAVHPLARHLFRRLADDADPLNGYLSVVTAAELLIRPIRAGAADLTFAHTFLRGFPHLHVLPVDLDVAMQAATTRATTRLPLPDSFLVASAMLAGCEAIVTNDEAWHRRLATLFPAFRWLYLSSR